jgi:SAM-dependent methyltransferase
MANLLERNRFMRWIVSEKLRIELSALKEFPHRIAILGGSSNDPEVKIINQLFPESVITYLGIDNYGDEPHWRHLDLNFGSTDTADFDLVICCQVLEHIWNLGNAFEAITNITKDKGYIWINCPTSNMAHGSPEYYSAGYSPDFLRLNLEALGFKTISRGSYGSKRYYHAVHYLRHWSTEAEHAHPVLGYRMSGGFTMGKFREMLFRLPGRIHMIFWNKKITSHINFSTESYYFGIKSNKLTS